MTELSLNWSTAQVNDGTLKVEINGEVEKDWKASFKTTVHLLGDGDWGEVDIKKGTVRVDGVSPGAEEKVRHFLESVVEQANASQSKDQDEDSDAADRNGSTGPDAEMTERFRSFAGDSDDDS